MSTPAALQATQPAGVAPVPESAGDAADIQADTGRAHHADLASVRDEFVGGGVEPAINLGRVFIRSPLCFDAGTLHDKRQINMCQSLRGLEGPPVPWRSKVEAAKNGSVCPVSLFSREFRLLCAVRHPLHPRRRAPCGILIPSHRGQN